MSITLTNPIIITQGATLETDSAAAVMSINIDFTLGSPIVIFTAKYGTVSGISLAPGTILGNEPTSVSINMTTGAWSSTSGASGTLNGAGLTAMLNAIKTFRNQGETFLTSNNIILGTQVAW